MSNVTVTTKAAGQGPEIFGCAEFLVTVLRYCLTAFQKARYTAQRKKVVVANILTVWGNEVNIEPSE